MSKEILSIWFYLFAGVLKECSGDFENVDDLYDAIGEMLEGVDSNKDEKTIRHVCNLLFKVLKE